LRRPVLRPVFVGFPSPVGVRFVQRSRCDGGRPGPEDCESLPVHRGCLDPSPEGRFIDGHDWRAITALLPLLLILRSGRSLVEVRIGSLISKSSLDELCSIFGSIKPHSLTFRP
jgi:hypothetical protein